MNKIFTICFLVITAFLFCLSNDANAQGCKDFSVPVWATVQSLPKPQITINWTKISYANGFDIRKKKNTDMYFPTLPNIQLDSSKRSWVDTNISVGSVYEYEVRTMSETSTTYGGYIGPFKWAATGYVAAGIEIQPADTQGKVLLMVDSLTSSALGMELAILQDDLTGEGWGVVKKVVPRAETFNPTAVKVVKDSIMAEYNRDHSVSAVYLFGRVPVPYSGIITPDGHVEGTGSIHTGAWPADCYYGDVNETWTDVTVNYTKSTDDRNRNIPGDGKFDQSRFNNIELMVGRVDLYNMDYFKPDNDIDLLRKYLDKNHKYRSGAMQYEKRMLIDDNFGTIGFGFSEMFASSGWRNGYLFFGPDSVRTGDIFGVLKNNSYMWAYGCGGGSHTSCSGVGNSKQFDTIQVNSIFSLFFGSWFGDWDAKNAFLRAPLCSEPSVLTNAWAGRPTWFFHHMEIGEPIGYSARLSMNNNLIYNCVYKYSYQGQDGGYPIGQPFNYDYYKNIHIALMGDPTLRMYMNTIPQPKNLKALQPAGERVHLSWDVPDTKKQYFYYIYRSRSEEGPYIRVNKDTLTDTQLIDTMLLSGPVYYMVRASLLETTHGGTYYKQSRGSLQYIVATGAEDNPEIAFNMKAAPNPAIDHVNLTLSLDKTSHIKVDIFDVSGVKVSSIADLALAGGVHQLVWDLRDTRGNRVQAGVYLIKLSANEKSSVLKVVVMP
ncbi:MAG: T9SS type A sorting domain-containing protein [Bacteroidota bacterium]